MAMKRRSRGEIKTRAQAARELCRIPNVGPAVAGDLIRLGITRLDQLRGRNAGNLYEELCRRDGVRHDICMLDVLEAVVSIADGRPARPWWEFSRKRKAAEARALRKKR